MQAGDPAFFWIGGRRATIFEELYNSVLKNCGFLLLTGTEGLGKTATLQALVRSLRGEVISGVINGPFRDKVDCYNAIAQTFALDREFTSKVQFLLYFGQFLHESEAKNEKLFLAVDDCHTLSQDLLEELRAISNIRNDDGSRLITIIMAGEPDFLELLDQPSNLMIRQQVSIDCTLEPLDREEVIDYIGHRLKAAGSIEQLFSEDAIQSLCLHSAGKPSEINKLCERALLLGANAAKPVLDSQVIEEATDPVNLARVSEKVDKTAAAKSENRQKDSPEILKAHQTPDASWSIFRKIQNSYRIKVWGGIILLAVLCITIFSQLSIRKIAPKSDDFQQGKLSNVSGSSPAVDKDREADNLSTHTATVRDKKNENEADLVVDSNDFWQSRKDSSRLIKVDRENIEDFITNFAQFPDTVFLLRSNDGQLSEEPVRDMQNLLVLHGIGPAQVKVMKSEEEDFVDTIAEIAHREGHKVLEVIVVQDGIWWGELGGKNKNN